MQPDSSSPREAPSSQTDRVLLSLREMLLTGVFAAGTRVTELDLATRLGASRTPVRHAMSRLAHEGLLEELAPGGFRVCAFTITEVWDAIELRGVLEGTAARLAAERLSSPDELEPLRACVRATDHLLPVNLQDFVGYLELNDRFHRALWKAAKSRMLLRAIEGVLRLPFAAPSALVFSHAESAESARTAQIAQEHHRAIVEAIEERAGARAESLAREHARIARANLARALEDRRLFGQIPGAALLRLAPGSDTP